MRTYEQAKELLLQFDDEKAADFIDNYELFFQFEDGTAYAIIKFLMSNEEQDSRSFMKYLKMNPKINEDYSYLYTEPLMLALTRQPNKPRPASEIEKDLKEQFTPSERLKIAAEQLLDKEFFTGYKRGLYSEWIKKED